MSNAKAKNGRHEKRPAFQFYPMDFLSSESVNLMTNEEVGVHIKMLCRAWTDHGVTADRRRLSALLHVSCEVLDEMLAGPLGDAWKERGGRLVNDRLEREREAAQENSIRSAWSARYGHAKSRGEVADGVTFEEWWAANDPEYELPGGPPVAPPWGGHKTPHGGGNTDATTGASTAPCATGHLGNTSVRAPW